MSLRTLACVAVVWAACGVGDAARAENYAFLVGVKDYDGKQLKPLTYSRDDIISLRNIILASGFRPNNVVMMHDDLRLLESPRYLADSKRVREELKVLLAAVGADDTLIVAFAGHGVQFAGEAEHFFCPLDADLSERSTLISLTELYAALEACPSRQKLLLCDACRNDPASNIARSSGAPALASVTQPQLTQPPQGIVALFSCAEGQQAFEHPDLQHGIFFHHVLDALRGYADDGDRELMLDELIAYTKSKTSTTARLMLGAAQTPRQQGFFDGEWVLRKIAPGGVEVPEMLGATALGEWTINGRTINFTYDFLADGVVVYRSPSEVLLGTYTVNGRAVRVIVGGSTETGSIEGNSLVLQTITNGTPGVATLDLQPAGQAVPQLAGKTARGEWFVNGAAQSFAYEFRDGGVVVYRGKKESIVGAYEVDGRSIRIRVGGSDESGTIYGHRIDLRTTDTTTGLIGLATVTLAP